MKVILYDSELKIMEYLWEREYCQASELVAVLEEKIGWNKNTTYTVLKKLVAKGYVSRTDPRFVCRALISREDVERSHAEDLVHKLFGGSNLMFLSSFVKNQDLTRRDIDELRDLIDNWSGEAD